MTIYNITGWGKGKTTSAIGIAARALENNEMVLFAQFLKNGEDKGIQALKNITIKGWSKFRHIFQGTSGFPKDENCTEFWDETVKKVSLWQPKLLVLDELNVALDYGLFDYPTEKIIGWLKQWKHEGIDIYITGRINNHRLRKQMNELADISTNCYCESHNYNRVCKKCGMDFNPHYEFCPICGVKLSKNTKARIGREC